MNQGSTLTCSNLPIAISCAFDAEQDKATNFEACNREERSHNRNDRIFYRSINSYRFEAGSVVLRSISQFRNSAPSASISDLWNNFSICWFNIMSMNWAQRKIFLYNVTFGLYMLDPWERYLFNALVIVLMWFIFYNGYRNLNELCKRHLW
ncbi:hypothetical protein L1887_38962 [Cichorium endivia]|nr:hypothetical protein L1887_38962 [Cichorium endivia]